MRREQCPPPCLRSSWVGTVHKSDIHHPQRWHYVAADKVRRVGTAPPCPSARFEPPAKGRPARHGAERFTRPWKPLVSHSSACKPACAHPLCWANFAALNTGRLPATVYFITLLTKLGALPIHWGNEQLIVWGRFVTAPLLQEKKAFRQ